MMMSSATRSSDDKRAMRSGHPILIVDVRCPVCGTAFRAAGGDASLQCPNCKRSIPRPVASNVGRISPPRYPFVYQDLANPKVADFRRRHALDRVVADAADELDALVAVRDWTF